MCRYPILLHRSPRQSRQSKQHAEFWIPPCNGLSGSGPMGWSWFISSSWITRSQDRPSLLVAALACLLPSFKTFRQPNSISQRHSWPVKDERKGQRRSFSWQMLFRIGRDNYLQHQYLICLTNCWSSLQLGYRQKLSLDSLNWIAISSTC